MIRVLHVLDHSIPLHSGYTFRTAALLREQRALGWETFHLTSPKQGEVTAAFEDVDGLRFFRTPVAKGALASLPVGRELALMKQLETRLEEVAREIRPDIIHAHSPVLNALPAIKVARRLGIPVVYEIRAFWEDAAVDHGTTREGSLRYRLTRALETWTMRRAAAVTTICEGLRSDILGRGIPAERVFLVATNSSAYGKDIGTSIIELLRRIFELDRRCELMIHNFEPVALMERTEEFVDVLSCPKVRVLYVPLNSGSANAGSPTLARRSSRIRRAGASNAAGFHVSGEGPMGRKQAAPRSRPTWSHACVRALKRQVTRCDHA